MKEKGYQTNQALYFVISIPIGTGSGNQQPAEHPLPER
jgi:hypothetical protein